MSIDSTIIDPVNPNLAAFNPVPVPGAFFTQKMCPNSFQIELKRATADPAAIAWEA